VLFRLTLAGNLSPGEAAADAPGEGRPAPAGGTLVARLAVACLVAGLGFLTAADAAWAHAIGVTALFGFAILGAAALIAPEVRDARERE
jgi:cytochrome d ubiquinol oxidase subunit II